MVHLALYVVLATSLTWSGQTVDPKALAEDLLDAELSERVSSVLEKTYRRFPGGHEAILTYRLEGQLDLRIQFPLVQSDQCQVNLWFVPAGAPPVFEQLPRIREQQPEISAVEAARLLRLTEVKRTIPCDGELARLLAQAVDFAITPNDPDVSPPGLYLHTDIYSFEMKLGDLAVSVDFPESLKHPIATWALNVKRAATTYIHGGLQ